MLLYALTSLLAQSYTIHVSLIAPFIKLGVCTLHSIGLIRIWYGRCGQKTDQDGSSYWCVHNVSSSLLLIEFKENDL
jgi:hypothetical protein